MIRVAVYPLARVRNQERQGYQKMATRPAWNWVALNQERQGVLNNRGLSKMIMRQDCHEQSGLSGTTELSTDFLTFLIQARAESAIPTFFLFSDFFDFRAP